MNWAEESVRRAKGAAPGFPMPEEPGELRDRAIRINERAESVRVGYFMGAKWQRDQLRTPEATERMAIHILSDDAELTPEEATEDWGQMYEEPKRRYRKRATQHINALLGED